MKKLIRLTGIAILAIIFQACSLDNEPLADGNHRFTVAKPAKVYKFNISLGGDYVTQSEEPLTRDGDDDNGGVTIAQPSTSTANTYIGINVTCKEKRNEGAEEAEVENYAYGVFTSKDNISIDLVDGYTYDFEATILRDRTDKYHHDKTNDYKSPFGFYPENDITGNPKQFPTENIGKFEYNYINNGVSALGYLCELSSGKAFIDLTGNNKLPITHYYMFPRVDRFYGKTIKLDPKDYINEDNTIDQITLPLSYKCFGLRIEVKDLPAGTKLTVQDKNYNSSKNDFDFLVFPENLEFDETVTAWEDVYSVNDLTSESRISFDLVFTWHRGIGKTETFESKIEVGPNVKKTLLVSVTGTANQQLTGNVQLQEITGEVTSEEENVTHTGTGTEPDDDSEDEEDTQE